MDKKPFDGLVSFTDACKLYGLNESTLRKAVATGRLIDGFDCKRLGNQWVTTTDVMERLYGEQPPANRDLSTGLEFVAECLDQIDAVLHRLFKNLQSEMDNNLQVRDFMSTHDLHSFLNGVAELKKINRQMISNVESPKKS